jgi:hypothetical protein
LSHAASAPDQTVTLPVPAALEPTISLYIYHACAGNNPVHAMPVATTCMD